MKDEVSEEQELTEADKKAFSKGADYEVDREAERQASLFRARFLAASACALACVSLATTAIVVTRHRPQIHVIEVDKATGESSALKQLDTDTIEYDVARDKFNIARYVQAREGYFYELLQRDYNTVLALSCDPVAAEYEKLYADENPQSLDKTRGAAVRIRPEIISIRLPPDEPGRAVVTFKTSVKRQGGDYGQPQRWVADVSYKYEPKLFVKESVWNENPVGFKVCAYRVQAAASES